LKTLGFGFVPPAARPAHARLDKPFRYFDFAEVNACYRAVLGVEPVPVAEFARLHDLAIIRHTVAHHSSVIRQIDVPRFQYYSVTPGALINPPPAFVRETSNYLYQIGTGFELAVRNHVFRRVIASLVPDWSKPPPRLFVDLIKAFDYFGILLSEPAARCHGDHACSLPCAAPAQVAAAQRSDGASVARMQRSGIRDHYDR
jgi:hypothetical protein